MGELFRNMLSASLQGSVVIAAVLALRLMLKKAPKKYICLLWILAGIRLLMPFGIESDLSLQPHVEQVELGQTVNVPLPEFIQPVAEADISKTNADTKKPDGEFEVPEVTEQTSFLYKVENGQIKSLTVADLAAVLWAAGTGLMLLYGMISYGLLKHRVREAVRLEGGYRESSTVDTAFILGYFRPRIYLPTGLSGKEREMILAHEKCHLKRLDHWTKLGGFAVLAVHWFNPLVWLGFPLLCRDIELACDESVVDGMELAERKAYSAALLHCSSNHRSLAACPVAFGEKPVKKRIKAVLGYRKPAFRLTLIAVVAIVFVAVCLMTNPREAGTETIQETVPQTQEATPKTLWKEEAVQNLYRELERIQSSEELSLEISTTIESAYDFFRGHEQCWHIRGDDWYRVMNIDTKQGAYTEEYLQKDGKQYARREAERIAKLGDLEWTQLPDGQVTPLYLLTRDWTEWEVLEVRKEKSTDGGVVTVRIQGDMTQTSEKTYYEHFHEFHLDEHGRLVGVVEFSFTDQYINQLGTEGRFYIRGWSRVRFTDVASEEIGLMIESAAEKALAVTGAE